MSITNKEAISSSLNVTKTEIKVSSLPVLQKINAQYNNIMQRVEPLRKEKRALAEQLFRLNCMLIPTEQLKRFLLNEDWFEPIDKVEGIDLLTYMTYDFYKSYPAISLKAPVLKEPDPYRYSNVFVAHDKWVWIVGGLQEAFKLIDKIKKYNSLQWQYDRLTDKRYKISSRITKIKQQGTVKHLPGKKRKQVA